MLNIFLSLDLRGGSRHKSVTELQDLLWPPGTGYPAQAGPEASQAPPTEYPTMYMCSSGHLTIPSHHLNIRPHYFCCY